MLNKTIARYCIISMIDIKVKCLCKFKKLSSDGENEKMLGVVYMPKHLYEKPAFPRLLPSPHIFIGLSHP